MRFVFDRFSMAYHWTASAGVILGIILLVLAAIWGSRNRFLPLLPPSISSRIRSYAPLSTFEDAAELGFSSSTFDVSGNIAGDPRAGLDERTLTDIRRLMERHTLTFDEARRKNFENTLAKNGIDVNGYPIDPKAVRFS